MALRNLTKLSRGPHVIPGALGPVGALALVGLARALVVQAFHVLSESMCDTIEVGDRILGEKVSLRRRAPRRGDIVFFDDPDGSGDVLVKRVIATQGETIDLIDGHVHIDGRLLDEPYALGPTRPWGDAEWGFPYTVPAGCVWLMGDNRAHSSDSRFFGAVPTSAVKARALCIYWPPSHATSLQA